MTDYSTKANNEKSGVNEKQSIGAAILSLLSFSPVAIYHWRKDGQPYTSDLICYHLRPASSIYHPASSTQHPASSCIQLYCGAQ